MFLNMTKMNAAKLKNVNVGNFIMTGINFHVDLQHKLDAALQSLPDAPIPLRSMFATLGDSFVGFFTHFQTSDFGQWLNKLSTGN